MKAIKMLGSAIVLAAFGIFQSSAQKHFWESNTPGTYTAETFSASNHSLTNLNWSFINDKIQKSEIKSAGIIFETKKDDVQCILDAELSLNIEYPTLLFYSFKINELNDKSRCGVVYNFEDTENYDCILFNKKNWYVVKCRNGRMANVRTGNNTLKGDKFNVGVSLENGKACFMFVNPTANKKGMGTVTLLTDDNESDAIKSMLTDTVYMDELYSTKASLTNERIGFVIDGKNKMNIYGFSYVQLIPEDKEE